MPCHATRRRSSLGSDGLKRLCERRRSEEGRRARDTRMDPRVCLAGFLLGFSRLVARLASFNLHWLGWYTRGIEVVGPLTCEFARHSTSRCYCSSDNIAQQHKCLCEGVVECGVLRYGRVLGFCGVSSTNLVCFSGSTWDPLDPSAFPFLEGCWMVM